ncbi:MAG: ArsR/SmtB family transcription factor [Acidobacteriota bacterium]
MELLARTFKSLADPSRLRLLRLLAREALSVGELTSILGLSQPAVSRHLGGLKPAGLVTEERDGVFTIYRLVAEGPLWPQVAAAIRNQQDQNGDLARLAEILRRRQDRGGGSSRLLEPGRSWPAWSRALGWMLPPLHVADLCCGDGALTAEIARWAAKVTAVDHDRQMVKKARTRMRKNGFRHVRCLCEPLEELSLSDGCVEMVILSQALHLFQDPGLPLRQAFRILAHDGRLLLLDLAPHGESWVKEKLGHLHLGFRPDDLARLLSAQGFRQVQVEETDKGPRQPFRIILATGRKEQKPASRRRQPPAKPLKKRGPGAMPRKSGRKKTAGTARERPVRPRRAPS